MAEWRSHEGGDIRPEPEPPKKQKILYNQSMTDKTKVMLFAWATTSLAVILAVVAWGQGLKWTFDGNAGLVYQVFPLFGLLAFSIMWSHYTASVFRQIKGVDKKVLNTYFQITSLLVLVAILLHPSLLWFQLWRDGYGLPPNSYLTHYVAPTLRWAAALGTLGLSIFLAYELRRFFDKKNWWKYIVYATDVAIIAIFVHGLKLGKNLQQPGWFQKVWYFYGITLLASLLYIYNAKRQDNKK